MPKRGKQQRKPKTKTTAPGADALAAIGHNSSGPVERSAAEVQELFLSHRRAWTRAITQVAAAKQSLSKVKALLKQDGFKVRQMQIADDLGTVNGEAKRTNEVDDVLRVARWIGHPMGAQLDLFAQASTTLSAESQQYERGRAASADNQPRKPPDYFAVGSDPYETWLEGYDDHQRELAGGFKAPPPTDGGTATA